MSISDELLERLAKRQEVYGRACVATGSPVAGQEAADTAEALRELQQLRESMRVIAAQSSGIPGSTRLSDCMAAIASAALRYS